MKVLYLPFADLVVDKVRWIDYQRRLFDWHCERFFDFGSVFTDAEMEYVRLCMAHSADTRLLTHSLSLFTYSHKVRPRKGDVNSSRMAYGTLCASPIVARAALDVVRGKGLTLASEAFRDPNLTFYGLGWDVRNGIDKVYFLIRDVTRLNEHRQSLIGRAHGPIRKRGILSFSFNGGAMSEEKVYVFPRRGDLRHAAVLCSRLRTVVQRNNSNLLGRKNLDRFSPPSKEIITAYMREMGTIVDTYVLDPDNDEETLYFDYNF